MNTMNTIEAQTKATEAIAAGVYTDEGLRLTGAAAAATLEIMRTIEADLKDSFFCNAFSSPEATIAYNLLNDARNAFREAGAAVPRGLDRLADAELALAKLTN